MAEHFTLLHLGCGRVGRRLHQFDKLISPRLSPHTIITLDRDSDVQPDLVCNLGLDPIPLHDNSVDLAVAIHVLEHIGQQGVTGEWFYFWEELYRVLKPGGKLQFESPLWTSVWSWADPSHTRALSEQAFCFFDQDAYRIPGSPISPYRICCDFVAKPMEHVADPYLQLLALEAVSMLRGTLTARKPLKPWWEDPLNLTAPSQADVG